MFITLLVATATLDGLPPYRTVLNCFHLFWTIVLIYFELFWYILFGWFYRLIIVLTFKLFTFKLFTFKFHPQSSLQYLHYNITFKLFTFKVLTLSSLQYYCASALFVWLAQQPKYFIVLHKCVAENSELIHNTPDFAEDFDSLICKSTVFSLLYIYIYIYIYIS